MLKRIAVVCCVLVALSSASDVLILSDDNFSDKIDDYEVILVMFYAPWCGHCKKLSPEFEKAAGVLKKHHPPITLAKIDCTTDGKATCTSHGIKGYPTIKTFVNGQFSFNYDGPKDAGAIVAYMKSKVKQGEIELENQDDMDHFLDSMECCVIGFFDSSTSPKEREFHKLSESLGLHYRFARTSSNNLMSRFGYRNDIVLFRSKHLETKLEPSHLVFDGNVTLYHLRNWVSKNCHGLGGYRTLVNREQFEVLPLVVLYLDSPDFTDKSSQSRYLRNRMMMVAKKFTEAPKRVTFAVSDAAEFKRELVDFGLGSETARPLISARDTSQRRYTFSGEFSLESLEGFVDDMLAGVLTPHVRTEPSPPQTTQDSGPVKVVIGTTFGEIVNDPTKDVLLMLRSAACSRCAAVVESWKKLAEKLPEETDIVFAQIDAVANELPIQYYLKGYPTIFFVSRNLKTHPVFYEGEHETKEFLKFLAREATTPLKNYERNGKRKRDKLPEKTEL